MKKRVPGPISGGLILSYKCSAECLHCMYTCSPRWSADWISRKDLEGILSIEPGKGKEIVRGKPPFFRQGLRFIQQSQLRPLFSNWSKKDLTPCLCQYPVRRNYRKIYAIINIDVLIIAFAFVYQCHVKVVFCVNIVRSYS